MGRFPDLSASWRTERLVLRPLQEADAVPLTAAVNASIAHLRPWMPWAVEPHTVARQLERIVDRRLAWLRGEDFQIVLTAVDSGSILGCSGFHPRGGGLGQDTTEVGIWVHAAHTGEGIATEAARGMLAWGLSDAWPWQRIEWRCDSANGASAAVARRVGFTLDGRLRQNTVDTSGARIDTLVFSWLRASDGPESQPA